MVYSFLCEHCRNYFEVVMSIATYNSCQSCPSCKKSDKVYRDYQADNVSGNTVNRTLGAWAEKQASKLSEDQKEHLWRKHNKYRLGPKPELPEGFERLSKEEPFYGQERKKKSKRKVKNL
jgi:hypothetical protein